MFVETLLFAEYLIYISICLITMFWDSLLFVSQVSEIKKEENGTPPSLPATKWQVGVSQVPCAPHTGLCKEPPFSMSCYRELWFPCLINYFSPFLKRSFVLLERGEEKALKDKVRKPRGNRKPQWKDSSVVYTPEQLSVKDLLWCPTEKILVGSNITLIFCLFFAFFGK